MGRPQDTDKEYVSELITADNQWDEQLIHSIFMASDADRILQIPLRRTNGEDGIAWAHDKSGIYSVRSAYRAMVAEKEQRVEVQRGGVSTSAANDETKWKKLWKLDVQPRV
jgi:hypothetical protein